MELKEEMELEDFLIWIWYYKGRALEKKLRGYKNGNRRRNTERKE
jgi:hypothetical protein